MTWTAPTIDRRRVPDVGDERTMLEGWLNFHRDTLLHKCAGLTAEQLKTAAVPPSNLTLLGLVRHMADVESWWFRCCFAGEQIDGLYWSAEKPDADFEDATTADAEADFAAFRTEVRLADQAAAGHDLDETFTRPPHDDGEEVIRSLRWLYIHMIEEYARHNGHADLIRERIDGATGD